MDMEPHVHPKVALILPVDFSAEEPQDQVIVYIVPGVPDCDILEYVVVRSKDLVRPGPHLLNMT